MKINKAETWRTESFKLSLRHSRGIVVGDDLDAELSPHPCQLRFSFVGYLWRREALICVWIAAAPGAGNESVWKGVLACLTNLPELVGEVSESL